MIRFCLCYHHKQKFCLIYTEAVTDVVTIWMSLKFLIVLSTLETKKCMRFDSSQRGIKKIKYKGKFESKWKVAFEVFSNKKNFWSVSFQIWRSKNQNGTLQGGPRQDTIII